MTIARKTRIAFISLAVLAAVFLIFLLLFLSSADSPGRKVTIVIPRGATVSQIGEILAERKVVKNSLAFRLVVEYKKMGGRLMAGEYELREGMTYQEALGALRRGPVLRFYTVTIPEGLTIEQTGEILASKTDVGLDEFRTLAEEGFKFDYDFLRSNLSASLEGYLFPKTYEVKPETGARAMINVMLRQFEKETTSLDWKQAEARGLTSFQVVIIASLIEKEARVPSERELISAVIHNRLRARIPLQIDATVQYALPSWKKKLTYEDLKVDSPYNTYLHGGLPPGPISNPGLASMEAALKPAAVDYLYYLVTGEDGSHTFTSSYQEFLRLKQRMKNGGK